MTDHKTGLPLDEVLEVYASRDGGWCNLDHGNIGIPDGWGLLPSGPGTAT